MTTTIVLGDPSDGYIESSSTSYSSALTGSNLVVPGNADPLMFCGQSLANGVRYIWQSFTAFSWTADTARLPVAAYLRLTASQTTGSATARDVEVREVNFGTEVNTADWRTPAQLAAAPLKGTVYNAHQAAGLTMRAGLALAEVDASATLRYAVVSSRNRLQQAPSGIEWTSLRQAEAANLTTQRPALYVTARTKSYLDLCAGAQVQLSDGTSMLLVATGVSGGSVGFNLVRHDGSTATTVFTGATVTGRRGAQAYALCRDASDNVYLLNRSGTSNSLNCRMFIKSGSTWTAGTVYSATLPTHDGDINNVAVAWHPQGGTRGTVVALIGHEPGSNTGTQLAYALVSCDHLRTGSGTLLRGSGDAEGVVVNASAPDGFNNPVNETGTLLDVTAVRDTSGQVSDVGYVTCTGRHQTLGQRASQSVGRYRLNATGTGFSSSARILDTSSGFSVKDADAKSRVLPVSTTQFVTVNASDSASFGLVVKHRQYSGGAFSVLADVRLGAQSIASMPAPNALATSSAWDAVYEPTANRVWVYYFDAADGRRLMRTHVDLTTGLAGGDQVVVNATVGATGSTNHAIRVQRGGMVGQKVVVSVANQASGGGAHSLIYVADTINLDPAAPTLVGKANFDATTAATFQWVFNDPGDSQSARQVEIWDDTTNTLVHDTAKTTSTSQQYTLPGGTLTNGNSYRWRVRTWDQSDAVSPWSVYSYFATSASGNVTITSPAADNQPWETAAVTVGWSVSGTTQAAYRVVVVRSDTSATHSDSGWVTSTDTAHTVTGLLSEVTYQIKVTVRNSASVESSTATRLITPAYTRPETPVVTVTPVDDGGHLRVEVSNPEPGDLVSVADGTFETSLTGWTTQAPHLVGSHSARNFGGTVTVNVPAGTTNGDLMLLAVTSNYDHNHSVSPSGAWGNPVRSVTVDGHGLSLYQRIASSEPSSYTATWTNPSNWHSIAIVVLRGVKELGAFASATVSSATSLNHPAITVGVDDWALLVGHAAESGPRTLPGSVTVLQSQEHGVIVGYQPQPAAGTAGPWTLSYTGNPNGIIAASQALTASATLQRSAVHAFGGTHSGLITAQGTPALAGIRPTGPYRSEVTANQRYTVQAMVYSPSGAAVTVRAAIDWYDTTGALISSTSNDTTVASGQWVQVTHTAAAPAGAVRAGYGPSIVSPSHGRTLHVDNIDLRTASDVPAAHSNQLWRSDGGPPVLVATLPPGGSYRDYMAGAGRPYTYHAITSTASGVTATSATVTGTARFQGVWIHDPTAPEATIRQYLYGRAQRSDAADREQATHHYAGRQHPVTQWGEHATDTWQITVHVPDGPARLSGTDSLRAWNNTRGTLVCRDNRGRVFVSTMSGFGVHDTEWGDAVSFTMTRVSSDLVGGER